MTKLPQVVLRSATLGGAAASGPLPASINPPSTDEVWRYAPRDDRAGIFGPVQVRINYD